MAKILVLTGLWLCLTHLYPKSLSASRILPQNRPATSSVRSPRRHIRLFREIWPGSSGRGREVGRGMVEGRVGQRVRALETNDNSRPEFEAVGGEGGMKFEKKSGGLEGYLDKEEEKDDMLENFVSALEAFQEENLNMYVPKDCFDCSDLGYMSTKIRKAYKDGNLPDTWKTRLHDIGFNFKIDMVDCKWHHNFHILRRYKFVEGHVDLPENYTDPDDPKTVECARWLQRQHVLYRKQKLRPLRVKMLRNIGVKLKRPYSPKRENRHVILLDPEKDKEAIQRWKKRQALSEALKANGTSLRKERQKRVDYYRKKRKEDKYLAKKELNSTK